MLIFRTWDYFEPHPAMICLSVFLTLLYTLQSVYCFNVGTKANMIVIHRGTPGTMFGFDVAFFKNGSEFYALVGAPRANSGHQQNVHRPGVAYKCRTSNATCNVIKFDKFGDRTGLNGPGKSIKLESKSDQWFGATVTALHTDEDGKDAVIVCAPFYKNLQTNQEINIEPVGQCFYANNSFRNIRSFSPCKQSALTGYHRHGYCMAGFSAAFGNDHLAYLGAPGAYYWGGMAMAQPLSFKPQDRALYTLNGSKHYDDQLMGYSVASGDFNGDNIDDVAVGNPKGNQYTGMVLLYSDKLRSLLNLTGDQLGSYYGHSVAVTDLDNNKYSDIIVGAPFYTNNEDSSSGVKSTYEIGRIYVYFQSADHKFDKKLTINGQKEWGRFGFDVAAVGDLNQDGYNDFIVGAPNDGKEKRSGAIYIFNGAKDGIVEKPSQIIYGHSIQPSIEGFGFSVSGGRDVDVNGYPDIVVGAPRSDYAVVFKSRPVIKLHDKKLTLQPNVLNLDHKNCIKFVKSKRVAVSCVKASACVQVPNGDDRSTFDLPLKFTWILDADKQSSQSRAELKRDNVRLSSLDSNTIFKEYGVSVMCDNVTIMVDEAIRDKLSPIVIQVNFTIDQENFRGGSLMPVVEFKDRFIREELKIHKNCGSDDVCTPDLQITKLSPNNKNISAGSMARFNVSVVVKNTKEPAYEAFLYFNTPKGMDIDSYSEVKGQTFTCDRQAASTEEPSYDVTRCDLGNPMTGERRITFSVSTKFFEGPFDNVVLFATVNSTNNETDNTLTDNKKYETISFVSDAKLEVFAGNNSYVYDVDGYKDPAKISWDEEIGPLVNHTYEIVNLGESLLKEVEAEIFFPSSTQDGRPLLYIVRHILISDEKDHFTTCNLQQKGNINPNNYGIVPRDAITNKKIVKRQAKKYDDEKRPNNFAHLLKILSDSSSQGWSKFRGFTQKGFNCMDMNCTSWKCTINDLKPQQRVRLTVDARLWTNTMIKEKFYDSTISSVVVAHVTKLAYRPRGVALPSKYAIATTTVTASDPSQFSRGLPWWLILLAILAGLALLVLLTLLLWRCGFFKRKRPPRGQALLAKPNEAEFYGYSTYSPANPNYPTHAAVPYGQRL